MPPTLQGSAIRIDVNADIPILGVRAGERVYFNPAAGTARVVRDISLAAAEVLASSEAVRITQIPIPTPPTSTARPGTTQRRPLTSARTRPSWLQLVREG